MPRKRLVLNHDDLKKKVDVLFNKLITEKDPKYMQKYLENPLGLLVNDVLPKEYQNINKQSISSANRFLFSVLANKKFLKWLESYQSNLIEKKKKEKIKVNEEMILKDFAEAFLKYGNKEMMECLLMANESFENMPEKQTCVAAVVVAIGLIAAVVAYLVVLVEVGFWGIIDDLVKEDMLPSEISSRQLRALSEALITHAEVINKKSV